MGGEGESSESAINPFFRMRREEEFFYSSFFLWLLLLLLHISIFFGLVAKFIYFINNKNVFPKLLFNNLGYLPTNQ
jgi:hypothetical protein